MRRIDWGQLGTVIAVVAGIGTLLFTGIATYYSALVSRDQLQQSRENNEYDAREQALRVSFWIDRSPSPMHVYLLNRSPDPVPLVTFRFRVWYQDENGSYDVMVQPMSLPPCTEVVLAQEDLLIQGPSGFWELQGLRWEVRGLHFGDRDGRHWLRTEDSLNPLEGDLVPASKTGQQVRIAESLQKKVANCGDKA
ncbi:hypothetical protein AB5J55_42910 [Streptomyces sp. R11]|uniref:Uncharacterized protein n=1 Tax=Streptomyces sp. R11 TaxID=3238625 RepID=A0AB39NG88_9ACTN